MTPASPSPSKAYLVDEAYFRDEPRPTEPQKQTLARGACLRGGVLQHIQTGLLAEGAAGRSGMSQAQSAADTRLSFCQQCTWHSHRQASAEGPQLGKSREMEG